MSKLPGLVSSRINEIRRIYVEANNRIVDEMDSMVDKFVKSTGGIPDISPEVSAYLEERIRRIREFVVDSIGFSISEFKTLYNPNGSENAKSRRFPKFITEALERSFEVDQYPSEAEKARLARVCKLSTKQINNWFTNKRNRSKGHDGSRQY
ncbi:putative homeodomain-containing transcription factor [Encephalitozoon hellem ATCC 50504]|uniref:Hepatocyte nuclear factor 6-like protein n=1 Tax=Encephalitozoon hellem TaxID=27973 RepID=A0A9Q9F8Z6_ENCHE|nr:putative homeodomain-containing transcription factor [Encephalitozoon hellem ATCC 50504]AFM99241.1 putative homeodomain-containing transcription factor [Encephalitozoon hellem ATCC 50504]UTX44229.1 hepatocyte nuclear factor 6-like protein [Encephalitozoon hellem]WEL39720.1 homeobox domain-containing protein [Encephalitozoon hellem]|eukprot:XP_003888222.1 putative homeodomain-containing transcription factor [Encephalitozoon hellem ATCC 50504]